MINLTNRQAKIYNFLKEKGSGSCDLNQVIFVLFDGEVAKFERQRAISAINALSKKMKCDCCSIKRFGKLGRGNIANYHFEIKCSSLKGK
jgi:hypothetical protein